MADYRDLLPSSPPRVIDPANPANNVWESGISGDSSILVKNIDTIDLSKRTTNNTVTVLANEKIKFDLTISLHRALCTFSYIIIFSGDSRPFSKQ